MIIIQIIACCAVVGAIGGICAYSNKAIDKAHRDGYEKGKDDGYILGWDDRVIAEKLEHLKENSKK